MQRACAVPRRRDFFTLGEPAYHLLTALGLSALTTGAARLIVPVIAANLAYFFLSLVPVRAASLADCDLRKSDRRGAVPVAPRVQGRGHPPATPCAPPLHLPRP